MTDWTHNQAHASYTMTEAARRLNLSRARFYQLIDQGVFPPPAYLCRTRQPVYPSRLLNVCAIIRRTGIGFNGQPVRFYRKRKRTQANPEHKHLATILRGMGLTVSISRVREAMRQLRLPFGANGPTDEETIRKLFKHFYGECQKGV